MPVEVLDIKRRGEELGTGTVGRIEGYEGRRIPQSQQTMRHLVNPNGTSIDKKKADTNGDGKINAKDVVRQMKKEQRGKDIINKIISSNAISTMKHIIDPTKNNVDKKKADANGDGKINAKDVIRMLKAQKR
jgi:Ca2+-binding EF-hand superfamily protein